LCSDYVLSALSLLAYEGAVSHSAAAAVLVSSSHLRSLFHVCLQVSPQAAFDQLRFQRALQMLTDTNHKLSTISDACGFSEVSAFSRAFKSKFGSPPSLFRTG